MKRKLVHAVTFGLFTFIILVLFSVATNDVLATSTPYYTYTTDNEQGWIRTSDAYTPGEQVLSADGKDLKNPQYVYVDHEDYVYVSDPGNFRIVILDKDLNYIDSLKYSNPVVENGITLEKGFAAINSIFVTEDKIYVPDSLSKAIFIFDRTSVLNRLPQYNLYAEDVDGSGDLSDGDTFYMENTDSSSPTGEAVYVIETTTTDGSNNPTVIFKDVDTNEEVFRRVDRDEMFGLMTEAREIDYDGTTVYKFIMYAETIKPLQTITTPDHPVFIGDPDDPLSGYKFTPKKVAVDKRGNMYVVGAQSENGLIMLDSQGDYITFFGGNPIRMPLIDQIRSTLLTEEQKDQLRADSDILIDYISSVAIDEKGFIYTVTSTLEDGNIKKFNVSGKNYFGNSNGWVGAVDLWVGNYGNILVIEEFGWINEYNADGDLVFSFSVNDIGANRNGLLLNPQSIAVDSNDRLFVVDRGNELLQIYEPTEFTNAVHTAFQAYQDGDEDLAKENWEYSLEYATVFDLAHEGIGNAYIRQENYDAALYHYQLASWNIGISDTYWQIRQTWLEQHLEQVMFFILLFFVLRFTFKMVNKRKHITKGFEELWKKAKQKNQILRELTYIKYFLRHPLDGYYEIKRKEAVSVKTASLIYFLLAVLFVFYQVATNVIFLEDPNANVVYELVILGSILSLWVIANYFVCLIRDGEGSFKNVFVATAMSLTPLLIVVPVITVLSNVLTYQEAVFYNGPLVITYIWVAIYFFFMIKEIHNYEVGETFGVIGISLFTMLIMGIFLFVIYSIDTQIFNVADQIARELMER